MVEQNLSFHEWEVKEEEKGTSQSLQGYTTSPVTRGLPIGLDILRFLPPLNIPT